MDTLRLWVILTLVLLGACSGDGDQAVDSSTDSQTPVTTTDEDLCEDVNCAPNSTCNDDQGTAVCECDTGFQDNDGDGQCVEDCTAVDCTNGSCTDASGDPLCVCDDRYAGAFCDECDVGFQDNDADGVCATACDANTCNDNGICGDITGTAVCICDDGYALPNCVSCDTDYQDHDGDGSCEPSCEANTCSGHGSCDDASGIATCTCDPTWALPDCSTCEPSLQDNDSNGTCLAACDLNTCSRHGSCDDSGGVATCTCDPEYAGPDCVSCEAGFQDNNADGSCEAQCDLNTCSGHGTCSDASGTPTCTCDPEHALPDCASCRPGFQDNDGDSFCAASCDLATCSGNGSCDDGSGAATCTCLLGWALPDCASCDAGFQDNDSNGTCEDACDVGSCPGFSTCDDSGGTIDCTCDTGYTGPNCDICDTGYQDRDGDGTCNVGCPSPCNGFEDCDDSSGLAICACRGSYLGGDCVFCPEPVLIQDVFNDGALATGGIGFSVQDNGLAGNGGAQEIGGTAEIFTADDNPLAHPMWTIVGETPIDTSAAVNGLHFTFNVTYADDPAFQGIQLGLQGDNSNAYPLPGGQPWMGVRIAGGSVDFDLVDDLGVQSTLSVGGNTYDASALSEGFYLVIEVDNLGWSYAGEGLKDDGSSVYEAGTWPVGSTPADLFDNADYITAGLQGDNADLSARLLIVEDITVLDGTCGL